VTIRSKILEMVSSNTIMRKEAGSEYDFFADLGRTMPLAALRMIGWCPLSSSGHRREGIMRGLILCMCF
jgi:hypothetical protein